MKKVIYIVGGSALIIVMVLILMFTGVLPNIFLDRSDLVCSRVYTEEINFKDMDFVTIKFNNKGIAKGGNKQSKFIYNDKESAQKDYEKTKEIMSEYKDVEIKIEDTTVILNTSLELSLDQEQMNRTKIKKAYEGFGYECE